MNVKAPLVSVIMPAYNASKFIKEAIGSVIKQSYTNWELIVVDDGSTDNTAAMVSEMANTDSRIILHRNGQNKGIVQSRNLGLNRANGKYIANLDSDDLSLPNRLEKQVSFMESNQDFVLIGSECELIDEKNKVLGAEKRDIQNDHLDVLLLFSNYFINSSVLFKAEEGKRIGYTDSIPLAEDYYLFSKLKNLGKIGNLNVPLIQYRTHANNISKIQKEELNKSLADVQREQLEQLQIFATEREMELHSSLNQGPFVSNKEVLIEIEEWLLKIRSANQKVERYNTAILNQYTAFFYKRYLANCTFGLKSIGFKNKSKLLQGESTDLVSEAKFISKIVYNSLNR